MPEEAWQRLLRDALCALALPPDEQIRISVPGCVACELLMDFDHARGVAMDTASSLTETQRDLLHRIDICINAMNQADFECFNNEVVRRPAWQKLRQLASDGQLAFAWSDAVVQSYVEVRPGLWQRPHAQ